VNNFAKIRSLHLVRIINGRDCCVPYELAWKELKSLVN
jgi:hypothetical protein